jgi:hypothetical protein
MGHNVAQIAKVMKGSKTLASSIFMAVPIGGQNGGWGSNLLQTAGT